MFLQARKERARQKKKKFAPLDKQKAAICRKSLLGPPARDPLGDLSGAWLGTSRSNPYEIGKKMPSHGARKSKTKPITK